MSTQANILIGLALFGTGILISAVFLRFLRTRYPAVWKDLGEPGLLRNNDLPTHIRISKYLACRRYRNLPDRRIVLLFDAIRIFEFFVIVSFAYFCVSSVLSIFRE